jgi:amino acid adenylation domain-containing protein
MAADTASMAVLHRELGALYAAFSSGGISLLPDLPFQYADYAAWQREYLQGEVLRRLVAFWRGQLADAPSLLAIPSDRHRPPAQSRRGAVCTTVFSAKLVETLNEFSHAHGATLFMTLLTAFKTVLHRYTGQEDIVVGTPLSGRNREGTGDLIGLFANTLVLRTPFAGDPTFVELLARVRDLTLTSAAHQDLPFEKLIDELHPKRDLSYDPVCQVLFALHDTPAAALKMDGLKTSVEDVHTCTAKTDLNVWAVEEPTGLRVSAEYSLDLFEAGTVERLLGHFRTMLEAITVDPHQRISLLPLLTSLEHMRILSDWNATAVEYPRDRCIHQLFEEQVARTPEATALVFNDRELSYVALNQLADKVAKRLRACGVGPDTLVALCVERSLEMMVGLLGIFKAGAAYVPLDPAFPEDRLTFMLEDSEAPVLVTQRHLQGMFGGKASVICLDADPASDEMPSDGLGKQNADAATSKPENLAYILYTSGSTGRPKGVMISHRNVINFFAGMDRVLGPEPGVWLAVTSISFDISVLELFWTLTRGFKVVILADQAGMKSAKNTVVSPVASKEEVRSLDEQLARHRITHLQCTPSFARLITRMPVTLSGLRPLRRMLVGGEALPADLAEVLGKAMDGDLINMYGPTETTVWSTTHKVQGVRSGTVDIGRPIANTEIYILDRHRQPLPVGIPGELYIGGDGLARGYWRRPELTTERFVEHPFSPGKARLYRTGDLARYRADGVIEFLGRADHQVKIRGHRIELGEIEAVLAQHPGVVQCVVVVRTDKAEDPRMAAYVVPAPSVLPDGTELRNVLRGKLPDHMVPDSFVFLERLPLTPNGKIDRNALPAPARKPAVAHAAHGHSSLPAMEQAIAAIWKDILSVDDLSPDDNFFDSGGRSFQVVQVKSRLYESLGVDLPVIKLFQYPTIRSLADFIGTQSSETDAFHNRIQERTRRRQHAMANWRMNSEEAKL